MDRTSAKRIDRRTFLKRTVAAVLASPVSFQVRRSAPAKKPRDPLADRVTIYRDEFGVPHILGETEEATFFGYGYAQAEDHLEKMMLQYLDAQGRLAELRGPEALGQNLCFLADDYRWGGDYLQRLLRTKKTVVQKRSNIDPQTYTILRGFARGINAYIAERRREIPAWIEPITPEDCRG